MNQAVRIEHAVGRIIVRPASGIAPARLASAIRSALDNYKEEDRISAEELFEIARKRHGSYYRTPGYYLRVYRYRAELTQARLAAKGGVLQHHISEMERNRRPIGKVMARKLAKILNCEYQRLL